MRGLGPLRCARLVALAWAMCLSVVGPAAGQSPESAAVAEAHRRPALAAAHAERAVLMDVTLAGARLVAVGERGLILLSDDEGGQWRQANVPVSVTLTAVRFPTPSHGWAVGHFGVVLHTDDGGENWRIQLDGERAAALALDAVEQWVRKHGDHDPLRQRQLNDARRLVEDGPDKPFFDLHFEDAQHGFVVGAYNLVFRTQDGGNSWESLGAGIDDPQALHLYAIRAHEQSVYLAGEQGLVLRSDNGGASFRRLETPYEGSYFTLAIGSRGEIVVAGMRGNAYRSLDRGESWEQIVLPAPVNVLAGGFDADNRLLLANQAGEIYVSFDLGRTVAPLPVPPLPPVTGFAVLPDRSVVATTVQGVLYATRPGGAKAGH